MVDKQEIAAIKALGQRMREARELCGSSATSHLSIGHAAELLNVDKLFLQNLEMGVDTENCPIYVIKRASLIFDVSIGFLLGETGEWENCEEVKFERNLGFLIHEQHIEQLSRLVVDHMKQQARQDALATIVKEIPFAIADISECVARFRELNPRFENMPCGSQLIHRTKCLVKLAREAKCLLTRHKIIPFQPVTPSYD